MALAIGKQSMRTLVILALAFVAVDAFAFQWRYSTEACNTMSPYCPSLVRDVKGVFHGLR